MQGLFVFSPTYGRSVTKWLQTTTFTRVSVVFSFASHHEVYIMNQKEFPQAIEMEKQLLSALFLKEGLVVPEVAAIIDADDLYCVEHRLVFQSILRLCAKRLPIDYLAVEEELHILFYTQMYLR